MKKTSYSIRFICTTAIAAAIVCFATLIPKIPIPLGYAHLGNTAGALIVYFIGRREGIYSCAIGSAMADFLGGFPLWIFPTLLIKTGMTWIMARFFFSGSLRKPLFSMSSLLGLLLSMLWMVFAYTLFGALLYGGLAAGLSSTPGLLLEGLVNIIATLVLGFLLEKRMPEPRL